MDVVVRIHLHQLPQALLHHLSKLKPCLLCPMEVPILLHRHHPLQSPPLAPLLLLLPTTRTFSVKPRHSSVDQQSHASLSDFLACVAQSMVGVITVLHTVATVVKMGRVSTILHLLPHLLLLLRPRRSPPPCAPTPMVIFTHPRWIIHIRQRRHGLGGGE